MFAKLSAEKEAPTTSTRLEKRKAEQRKQSLRIAKFYNLAFNQPGSSYAEFIAVKISQWFSKFQT